MKWSLKQQAMDSQVLAADGDETALSDIRAYIAARKKTKTRNRWKRKIRLMKKLLTAAAAIALVVSSSGCMTNGIANIAEALRQDTNSIHLKVDGWGVSITLDRNAGGASLVATDGTGAVTLTPVTTLKVQQAK